MEKIENLKTTLDNAGDMAFELNENELRKDGNIKILRIRQFEKHLRIYSQTKMSVEEFKRQF